MVNKSAFGRTIRGNVITHESVLHDMSKGEIEVHITPILKEEEISFYDFDKEKVKQEEDNNG